MRLCLVLAFFFTVLSFYLSHLATLYVSEISPRTGRVDFLAPKSSPDDKPFALFENGAELAVPDWIQQSQKHGYSVERKPYAMDLTLKALKDATVSVELRGPHEWLDPQHKEKGLIEHWVDYRKLIINGQEQLKKNKAVWHDLPYILPLQIKAEEEYFIQVRWQKMPFYKTLERTDWCYFVILAFFYFFISYKTVRWFSRLKTDENRTVPDILFLAVFFALLTLPTLRISDAEKSEQENRMLAAKPELFVNHKFNSVYGTQFEQWFNDRFFGREKMLKLHSNFTRLNRYATYGGAQLVKDEWLLGIWDQKPLTFSENELENIFKGVSAYNDFCRQNHISCYLEIVPRKLDFMRDKIFRKVPAAEKDRAQVLTEYLRGKDVRNIIYPAEQMQTADKKDFIYFKTDHHWTEWGAYTGYQELMKRIKYDYPQLQPVTESDYTSFYSNEVRAEIDRNFWEGHTCRLMRLDMSECPLNTRYKNYTHKDEANLKINRTGLDKDFSYAPAKNRLKAVIIGNSFTENFSSFLAYTFTKVKKIRCNTPEEDSLRLSRWKKEITGLKPDIMMIVIHSEYSNHLEQLKD